MDLLVLSQQRRRIRKSGMNLTENVKNERTASEEALNDRKKTVAF